MRSTLNSAETAAVFREEDGALFRVVDEGWAGLGEVGLDRRGGAAGGRDDASFLPLPFSQAAGRR